MNLLFTDGTMMNSIRQAFCWMLIHSLWQGLLFTIITGFTLLLTKKSSAALRYNLISGFLLLFILLCAFTFLYEFNTVGQHAFTDSVNAKNSYLTTMLYTYGIQNSFATLTNYFSAHAPVITMIWFFVFCYKCARMTSALIYNGRIRHRKIYAPSDYWLNRIELFSQRLQLKRKVLLYESETIRIPIVLGHLKPVILVPLGLLANLPAEQVEAVLLHELAHIRRSDYFVNLLQNIAESVFFFNPGLLWISSLLKEERENCCDDIALSQTKNKKQFIEALVSFKEYAAYTTTYSPAFPGKKNLLLQRATRIIYNKNKTLTLPEKIFFTGSLFVLLAISVVAGNKQIFTPAPLALKKEHGEKIFPDPSLSLQEPLTAESKKLVSKETKKKHKPIVIEYYNKIITTNNKDESLADQEQAETDEMQAMNDNEQAELDRKIAEQDRQQAMMDYRQADEDSRETKMDKEQAEKNKQLYIKDKEQKLIKPKSDIQ